MTPDGSSNKRAETRGSAFCQEMAESILDDYTEQLIDMVENSTHGLTIPDIRAFLETYKSSRIANHESTFKIHFQKCLNRREQEVFDPNRHDPFKRVVTMRFIDMFPSEGALDPNGKNLSRRMLRGLFKTLEKMTGTEPFIHGNAVCQEIMEEVRNTDGVVIWEDLYVDERALGAVDNMLMNMVRHFAKPMERITWMVDLINNDLSDPLEFDFEGDTNAEWTLSEACMVEILRHLLRHLRHQLVDKKKAQALVKKYGTKRTRQLAALIHALDQAAA